jgi:hypothetical protein
LASLVDRIRSAASLAPGSTAVKRRRPLLVEPSTQDTVINKFPNDSLLIPIGVRPMHPDNDLRPVMRTFGTFDR